jgi:hypothetical protein
MKIKVVYSDRLDGMIGAKFIKWFEKTDYSHVGILFEDSYMYEAVYPTFQRIHINDWLKHRKIVKVIELEALMFDYNNAHHKAMSLIGTKYGVFQLGLIFAENILKRAGSPLGEAIGNVKLKNKQLLCTESNLVILKQIGVKFKGSIDTISLNDFDSIVSKFKQERTI